MTEGRALDQHLDAFLQAYLRMLTKGPDSGDPEVEDERRIFAELLGAVDAPTHDEAPVDKPVCRFLGAIFDEPAEPMLAPLLATTRPLAMQAVWRNKYRQLPGREALFENFAFCDFIGSDGWRSTAVVTLGLTMLGPNTDYPFHQHPARELYLLLSGPSYWAVDFQRHRHREPGIWLLHREMQPHAIRSDDEPMLAISAWRGDIETRSRFCQPGQIKTAGGEV